MAERQNSNWQVEVTVGEWPAVLGLIRASQRGELFVCSSPPAPVDTPVDVSLTLPDNSQVNLPGKVIGSNNQSALTDRPAGFTISFSGASSSDLVLLESMASANCDDDPDTVDLRQFTIGANVIHRSPLQDDQDFGSLAPDQAVHDDDDIFDDEAATVTSWPPPPPREKK
jgi:hypothetical protein